MHGGLSQEKPSNWQEEAKKDKIGEAKHAGSGSLIVEEAFTVIFFFFFV